METRPRALLPDFLRESPRPRWEPLPVAPQDVRRVLAAGQAALDGELAKLEAHPAEPGSGRHTALFAAAAALGHHVAAGGLARLEVESQLRTAAQRLALPEDAETVHQIEHGLMEGEKEPYVLTDRTLPPHQASAVNGRVNGAPPPSRARLRSAAEIAVRPVTWAWDQRAPLGKLTVLAGLPGQGKSLLSAWLAARASTGALPGALEGLPQPVLLVSAEDDPEDTIVPRLLRCGADLSRISILDIREPGILGKDYTRSVRLPEDVPSILESVDRIGARVVVLDPVGGMLGADHDAHKAQHVRQALGPLKEAAEEYHAAVILIHHVLTKNASTEPLARLADSHAFAGLPRSVLIFGPDPQDAEDDRGREKVLTLAKSNVAGPGQHGLRFTITDAELVSDGRGGIGYTPGIRLDGITETTAAETLASAEERGTHREVAEFLEEYLADGEWRLATEVKAAALEQGISAKVLRSVRERMCEWRKEPGVRYGRYQYRLRSASGQPGQPGQPGDAARAGQVAQDAQDAHGHRADVLHLFPSRGPEEDPEEPEGEEDGGDPDT